MTKLIASDGQWPIAAAENVAGREQGMSVQAKRDSSPPRSIAGLLDDAVLLSLIVFLFPLLILLIGAPIALLVRFLVEIAQRL